MKRKRKTWFGLALGGLLLACCACMVWGASAYLSLMRLRVEVADAGRRVEAASHSRAALVANLSHGLRAFGCLGSPALNRLDQSARRAAEPLIAARVLTDPARYTDFRQAQLGLSSTLERLWPEVRREPGAGARVLAEDLESEIEDCSELLTGEMERLDRSIGAYRTAVERLPGSLVAGVAGLDGGEPLPRVLQQ